MRHSDDVVRASVAPRNRPLVYDGRIPPARFRHCEKPVMLGPGRYGSCRACEPCIERIVYDAVGRIQAEAWCSARCFFMTMTIGGDRHYGSTAGNPKAQELCKQDVRAANMRLRKYINYDAESRWKVAKAKHLAKPDRVPDPGPFVRSSVRYFNVGEFGDLHGRPHYHQIVFLQNDDVIPDLLVGRNYLHGKMDWSCRPDLYPEVDHVRSDRTYWPWGTTHIKEFHRNDAYYIAQYAVKTVQQRQDLPGPYVVMAPGRSVRPLLGAGYFDYLAHQTALYGLPLREEGYRLPVDDPFYRGPSGQYHMTRTTKAFLFDRYRHHWVALYGGNATQRELPAGKFTDRLFAVEDYRKLKVWSEGQKFFQDSRNLLELNRRKAADAAYTSLKGVYGAIKEGATMWGREWRDEPR